METFKIKLIMDEYVIEDTTNKNDIKILMLKGEKGDTVSAEWGTITGTLSDQLDLKNALDGKANTSDIPTATSDLTNDSGFIDNTVDDLTNYTLSSDLSDVATSGDYSDLSNTPSIPSKTSDLTNDSGFITTETDPVFSASAAAGITSTDITNWNGKSDFSGDYDDLENKPTIPDVVNSYSTSQTNTYSCDYINKITGYSTTEQVIGKWITGKPLYRKVIDLGTLPNASTKTIPTGLTFNSTHCILTKLYGIASYSNGISFPLPFSSNNGVEYNVSLNVDNSNNVAVTTAQDRSGMTGYAVLEYIKATD